MEIAYVALGDSIAAGGPTSFSYVDLVAAQLREQAAEVVVRNLAVNGAASEDLLRRLRRGGSYTRAIASADLLTITIGGNDLIRALRASFWSGGRRRDPLAFLLDRVAAFERNWIEILDRLVELRPPGTAALRATNYYDPLPDNPVFEAIVRGPLHGPLRELSRERNRRIRADAEERGFLCADVYRAFNDGPGSPWERGLLAYDGFHPSEAGQRLIGDTVHALGYAPLVVA